MRKFRLIDVYVLYAPRADERSEERAAEARPTDRSTGRSRCRSIPESWPTHVQQRARTFLALLKYYRFSRTLGEAAVPFLMAREAGQLLGNDDAFRGITFLNYWIASRNVTDEVIAEYIRLQSAQLQDDDRFQVSE